MDHKLSLRGLNMITERQKDLLEVVQVLLLGSHSALAFGGRRLFSNYTFLVE